MYHWCASDKFPRRAVPPWRNRFIVRTKVNKMIDFRAGGVEAVPPWRDRAPQPFTLGGTVKMHMAETRKHCSGGRHVCRGGAASCPPSAVSLLRRTGRPEWTMDDECGPDNFQHGWWMRAFSPPGGTLPALRQAGCLPLLPGCSGRRHVCRRGAASCRPE